MFTTATTEARRRAWRSPTRTEVSWGTSTHLGHDGAIVDASSDGIFVAFSPLDPSEPAANDTVLVGVFVAGEGHVVEGRVRWVGTHRRTGERGMGVAFVATSAYEAEALAYALFPVEASGVFARPLG